MVSGHLFEILKMDKRIKIGSTVKLCYQVTTHGLQCIARPDVTQEVHVGRIIKIQTNCDSDVECLDDQEPNKVDIVYKGLRQVELSNQL